MFRIHFTRFLRKGSGACNTFRFGRGTYEPQKSREEVQNETKSKRGGEEVQNNLEISVQVKVGGERHENLQK